MVATLHDSTSSVATTNPVWTVPRPTLSNNDWLYIWLFTRGSTTVTTDPTDFDTVPEMTKQSGTTATNIRCYCYRKKITNAGAEPATYTGTLGTNVNGSVIAASISGADGTEPMQVASMVADTGSDATIISPAVSTSTADTLIIRLAAMISTTGITDLNPTALTADEDTAPGAARAASALAHVSQPAQGGTGTVTWTATGDAFGPALGTTVAFGAAAVVAGAGSDQTIASGTNDVELDGSGSTGSISTYAWTQLSGPAVTITNPSSETATFDAPTGPATLTFRLTVTGPNNSSTDDTTITVNAPTLDSLKIEVLGADGYPMPGVNLVPTVLDASGDPL